MQELTINDQKYPVLNLTNRPAAMLDCHVAEVYGVGTKRVNEAVSRNPERFPDFFMYRLTKEELTEVVANCDHLDNLKDSPHLPQVFTWEGCNMLATILKIIFQISLSYFDVEKFTEKECPLCRSLR